MKQPTLGNPQNTIAVLQKYNFVFQKKFGQNFLIDTHVLDKIIRAAQISGDDCVLENWSGYRDYDSISGVRGSQSYRGGD